MIVHACHRQKELATRCSFHDTPRFSPLLGFGAGRDAFLGKVRVGFV